MQLSHRWIIVAAGAATTCIGLGSMFALAVFLDPIAIATGWSRTGISLAATLNFVFMGATAFAWGALADRYGTRAVVLGGGLLMSVGLGAASQAASLSQFQVFFGAIVGTAAGSFYAPLSALATVWFTRHRSLAVALITSGIGIGSMTVAPTALWLTLHHDWRTAMAMLAAAAMAVIAPASLVLSNPPERSCRGAKDSPSDAGGPSALQAMRSRQFAVIAAAQFLCCAAHSGPIFHMVAYAISCGVPAMTASSVFGVAGLSALGGRVACGLLADRLGTHNVLTAVLLLQSSAIGLYLLSPSLMGFYALSVVFGLAYGGVMPLYAVLARESFDARIMGTTFGAIAMVSTFGMAFGPLAGGWIAEQFGEYWWLYAGSSATGLAAVLVALTYRPAHGAVSASGTARIVQRPAG